MPMTASEGEVSYSQDVRVLLAGCTSIGLFSAFVALIAQFIGAEFALPNQRVFTIIGVHSWVPMCFAVVVYLLYQLISGKFWRWNTFKRVAIDFSYMALVGIGYYAHMHLKAWVPFINVQLYDSFFWQTDLWLRPLTQWLDPLSHAIRYGGYFEYFYQFIYIHLFMLTFLLVAYVNRPALREFVLGLWFVIIFGGITYLLFPAVGPFIYEAGLSANATTAQTDLYHWYNRLQGAGIQWLNKHMSDLFGASLAAMPSLHVAYSLLMLVAMWKTYRNVLVRGVYVLFLLLVICESVWSKWHYWIDAPAGIALALLCGWLAQKIIRNKNLKDTNCDR